MMQANVLVQVFSSMSSLFQAQSLHPFSEGKPIITRHVLERSHHDLLVAHSCGGLLQVLTGKVPG